MNHHIRRFIAAGTLIAMTTPFAAFAAGDTAYVGGADQNVSITQPEVTTPSADTYVPVRSALTGVSVGVDWQSGKVTLTYGGQSSVITVDAASSQLQTSTGTFAYRNINGSLQAPLDFFQALFNNATVAANGNGGITLTAVDASQAITLAGVQSDDNTSGDNYTYYESGLATWYGSGAQGNYTASGEIFNMYDYTAAHKYLPFGTVCRVIDTDTGRSVIVRINDRGPFGAGRVIDLSYQAASDLGIVSKGVAPVTIEVLS